MGIGWITCLALLFGQGALIDDFQVEWAGQLVAIADRERFILPLPGVPVLDVARWESFLDDVNRAVYREPVNARMDHSDRIIPERMGRKLDRQALTGQFLTYLYGLGGDVVEAPSLSVHPRVDRHLLRRAGERLIGRYVTYYNPRNLNRSHNIALAAKAIDSIVVLPGETFSFNGTVGKRTTEKGYLPAPIIVKGELSEGVGGGICQVSSTLFNAVDRAGLKIVQRYSHSRRVAYVPPGRDATVSWYGPDFRFQNEYPHPVLIRARARDGQMIVSVHSFSELEYEPRFVPGASRQLPEETPSDGHLSRE